MFPLFTIVMSFHSSFADLVTRSYELPRDKALCEHVRVIATYLLSLDIDALMGKRDKEPQTIYGLVQFISSDFIQSVVYNEKNLAETVDELVSWYEKSRPDIYMICACHIVAQLRRIVVITERLLAK